LPADNKGGEKKKQIPHPSALCAYGLRMTTKGGGDHGDDPSER